MIQIDWGGGVYEPYLSVVKLKGVLGVVVVIGRNDAAQLSALQILAEIGFVRRPESCALVIFYVHLVINFLPIVFSFS